MIKNTLNGMACLRFIRTGSFGICRVTEIIWCETGQFGHPLRKPSTIGYAFHGIFLWCLFHRKFCHIIRGYLREHTIRILICVIANACKHTYEHTDSATEMCQYKRKTERENGCVFIHSTSEVWSLRSV